jgi:tetratricopeptide (TPR) repeat protein
MASKDQIKTVRLDAAWRRALLVAPAALALWAVWTVGRWCVGNTLASNPPEVEAVLAAARIKPNDPVVQEGLAQIGRILSASERFAPDDPQVHFTLGVFARKSFEPEELQEALRRFERATALSPHDYRLWMELGRARGQAGDEEGGERALRHSVELAPHYSLPRWYLGNLLLRAGRDREAFAELRRAAEIDTKLHTQVFTTAWSYFGGDVRAVAAAVGDSTAARGRLVRFLVSQKRLDEALVLWGTLGAEEKRAQNEAGRALTQALGAAGRQRKSLEVFREIQPGPGGQVAPGQVMNGGFEADVNASGANPFDWFVRPVPQAQMGLDARAPRGGRRSLRVDFSGPSNFQFGQFSQLLLVEPGARYRLTYFVRTEELRSTATLLVEVAEASGSTLAAAPPVAAGTSDWRQESIEFTTPAGVEGLVLRVVRQGCNDASCPIFGKVWYDDFSLQRIAGGAGARAPKGQ